MNTPIKFLAAAGLSVFSLLSCGKDGYKAPETVDQTVEQLSLTDQWASGCRNERFDVFGVASLTEHYDFGDSVTKVTTLYAADNCADAVVEVREAGSYAFGDTGVYDDARALDMTFESVKIKPLISNAANALNAVRACSRTNWKKGVEVDVTANTSNDAVMSRCWPQTPRTIYDIADISGDELRFGLKTDTLDKTSAEKRTTALDPSIVLTRQ